MRELVKVPDPRLRMLCSPVKSIDSLVRSLAFELKHYVLASKGKAVGMSAPQLGEMLNVFVIETPALSLVLINPRTIKSAGLHMQVEGCLSLPSRYFLVSRPKLLKLNYLGLDRQWHALKLHDHYAGIAWHEMNHLLGKTIDVEGQEMYADKLFGSRAAVPST